MEQNLIDICLQSGAFKASVIETDKIQFDKTLRKYCEDNVCGNYGKNYACPPAIGDTETVINKAKQYKKALVFQTVTALEDSYDFEGMMEVIVRHGELSDQIDGKLKEMGYTDYLRLMAGGCPLCKPCAMAEGKPCRHPERCFASLEAYCINVSELASICGMNYINGQDTVTYFGAFFFRD